MASNSSRTQKWRVPVAAGYPAAPRRQPAAAPAQPRRLRSLLLWLLALAATAFFILGAALLVAAFIYNSALILPGARVMGVNVGGLRMEDAVSLLQEPWEQQEIVLAIGDETWTVDAPGLGFILDGQATARQAHRQSRSLEGLLAALSSMPLDLKPAWRLEADRAAEQLQALAPQVAREPVSPGLQWGNGRVEATAPVDGRALDMAATLYQLQLNAAHILGSGHLELITAPVAPAIGDVNAAVAAANAFLTGPFQIRAYDPVRNVSFLWEAPPAVWGSWLIWSLDENNPADFDVVVDKAKVEAYLLEQATGLGETRYLETEAVVADVESAIAARRRAASARVYHREQTYVVQPGDTFAGLAERFGMPYPWLQEANPGVEALWPGQVLIIPSPDRLLPLPIVENKRIVISLAEQRLWAYENGGLKWEWPVSTGIESSPTSPGVFQVQTHELNAYASVWDLWMPHFMGIYQPVPNSDFMNGFHGFPTRNGHTLLWTGDLGHPVTYGCILLSSENAELLYQWAEEGVVVEIRP